MPAVGELQGDARRAAPRASPCSAAMRGWEDCIVALPTDQWECNVVGKPVPKDRACTEARANVISCISWFPQWPPPKK